MARGRAFFAWRFDDGTYTINIPDTGLTDPRELRSKDPGNWGTYTIQGATATLKMTNSASKTVQLKDNRLYVSGDDYFLKTQNPQGARISGDFAARTDPSSSISLGADGRFTDRGGIGWALNESARNNYAGAGKYEIRFYTIEFNYDDGRKMRVTTLNGSDPRPTSIRLGTDPLLKRR